MPRGGRQKGADTHKLDKTIVPGLALMCWIGERDHEWSYFRTIRAFVERTGLKILGGKNVDSTVHRLYQKVIRIPRLADPRILRLDPEKFQVSGVGPVRKRRSKSK